MSERVWRCATCLTVLPGAADHDMFCPSCGTDVIAVEETPEPATAPPPRPRSIWSRGF